LGENWFGYFDIHGSLFGHAKEKVVCSHGLQSQ
jgi:hypothetical protein